MEAGCKDYMTDKEHSCILVPFAKCSATQHLPEQH